MGRKKKNTTSESKPPKLAEIKAEYISGEISLRALAKKHGISESKLFRHCKKESWQKKREEYRSNVTAEAIALAGTRAIGEFSQLIDMSKALAGEIQLALGDPTQLYQRIVMDKNGEMVAKTFSKLDTKATKDLAGAIEKLANVIGAAERAQTDGQVQVVMDASAEEYSV